MATVWLLWNVPLVFDHDREYFHLTCSEETLVVVESSLEAMLSPLQNCSEGDLSKLS